MLNSIGYSKSIITGIQLLLLSSISSFFFSTFRFLKIRLTFAITINLIEKIIILLLLIISEKKPGNKVRK